jgi:hypothetical protein
MAKTAEDNMLAEDYNIHGRLFVAGHCGLEVERSREWLRNPETIGQCQWLMATDFRNMTVAKNSISQL